MLVNVAYLVSCLVILKRTKLAGLTGVPLTSYKREVNDIVPVFEQR